MNTNKLCFKAGDILNGSVPLQFIIGLADSLADQVTSPPNYPTPTPNDHHRIPTPTDHQQIITTHWWESKTWNQKSQHCIENRRNRREYCNLFWETQRQILKQIFLTRSLFSSWIIKKLKFNYKHYIVPSIMKGFHRLCLELNIKKTIITGTKELVLFFSKYGQ